MTKEEAQTIIDGIDSSTVIDSNWLDYLLDEPGLTKLQALRIVTEMNWKQLIELYKGLEISLFQTEKYNNYVGKIIDISFFKSQRYSLIISQDARCVYYMHQDGDMHAIHLEEVENYLIK